MISNKYLFSNIDIDSVGFHAPKTYIKLDDLAKKRKVDPNKFRKGLMAHEMRVPEVNEDIISLGLKAGYQALTKGGINPKSIDALFVGTETITYAVKSVSNIFAELLEISPNSITQDQLSRIPYQEPRVESRETSNEAFSLYTPQESYP